MKLLVIILCLLSERFLIHSMSYRRFFWFEAYYAGIKKIIDKNHFLTHPWITLITALLPLILLVSFIYFLFQPLLFGFVGLLLNLALFFYCLGPENVFYPLSEKEVDNSKDAHVRNYFAKTNSQLFSVIFWYSVAGPMVLFTYRLITLCKKISFINVQAHQITSVLEWIPARMTTLLFLLVGNFQRSFPTWIKLFFSPPKANDELLGLCGLQAVRTEEEDKVVLLSAAEHLVEHATIVLLVFIALFTLVAWL